MSNEFALDLKVARKKSGLTQADCGHLLDASRGKVSQLERGKTAPSVRDICTLSILYGKSFESLFGSVFEQVRQELKARLATIPGAPKHWLGRFNRTNTLNLLSTRLHALAKQNHGPA